MEPDDLAAKRGAFEEVLMHIPGFRGYLQKEHRRESDAMQRRLLADRLQQSKRGLDDLARNLVQAAQIDRLPEVERIRGRLETLIHHIGGAMQGYSAFFDLPQVDEAVLARVYDFDVLLMKDVDAVAVQIEQASSHGAAGLSKIDAAIADLEARFRGREQLLSGLATSTLDLL